MPNRIIKESIHTSEKINALSDFQFRLWVSLICYVDDYGRGDARPAVIRGTCFPLRDRVTNRDIEAALSKLADAGCVGLYTVDGKPYLYLLNWESHQRIRQKVSKCPEPPLTADCGNLPQVAASCGELPQNAATCGLNPESESRIQNTNPNTNPKGVVVGACAREDPFFVDMGSPWVDFVKVYEQNIGLMPTSEVERGDLTMFFDEFGGEALSEFARYTARKHPDNPHVYFAALCRKYLGKGIRSAQQASAALGEFERRTYGDRSQSGKPANPALDYDQRSYAEMDESGFFIDLTKEPEGV